MTNSTQGSTTQKESEIAGAKRLFERGGLFLLTRKASSDEAKALLEKLNATEGIADYVMLTEWDIVPADLLAETEAACRLLRNEATFWSSVLDQEEVATGAPGRHRGRVAVWAFEKDASCIWDKHF